MSRLLSTSAKAALTAQETGEAFLMLLTMTHPDLATPLRFTSDAVDTISNAQTFVSYPFDLELPVDDEGQISEARLTIDNVHRDIVLNLRRLSSPVKVLIQVIMSSSPDTIEAQFPEYELLDVQYDANKVSGTLTVQSFLNEPFPGDLMGPTRFKGLF